jgi:hypothetical protein
MEQEDHKIDFKRMIMVGILWLAFVIGIMFAMASCSAERHLKKADKHIKKAIDKGAVITPDTLYKYIYRTDTLYDVKTDTYTITNTIVDSIPYLVTEKVYVPMSRQERLKYRDSLDHIRRLYKLQNERLKEAQKQKTKQVKQEQKTERKNSPARVIRNLLWLLVVLSVIYVVIKFYRKL